MGIRGRRGPTYGPFVLCKALLCPVSPIVSLPGRSTLARCCNAPAFLFTTQKNTPLGTKLKYEVENSGMYYIHQEIFRMFPKVSSGRGCWVGEHPAMALEGNAPVVQYVTHCSVVSWPWLTRCHDAVARPLGFLGGPIWTQPMSNGVLLGGLGKKMFKILATVLPAEDIVLIAECVVNPSPPPEVGTRHTRKCNSIQIEARKIYI